MRTSTGVFVLETQNREARWRGFAWLMMIWTDRGP